LGRHRETITRTKQQQGHHGPWPCGTLLLLLASTVAVVVVAAVVVIAFGPSRKSNVPCGLFGTQLLLPPSLPIPPPPLTGVVINASVAGFLIIPVTKPPFKFAMNAKQPNS